MVAWLDGVIKLEHGAVGADDAGEAFGCPVTGRLAGAVGHAEAAVGVAEEGVGIILVGGEGGVGLLVVGAGA